VAADAGAESALMLAASLVALAGIGLATFFFLKRRDAADEVAARFSGVYRVLLNKYYVDDIYDAAIVQPIRIISEDGLWRGLDVRVIDGAVNGAGALVVDAAQRLRRLQTGSVRVYAASLFLGVVTVLGYYLWRLGF
jgi:NADH-quinone oxidoreductase subunit L